MDELVLDADIRTVMGKKNRALRAHGFIPIHVYGLDSAPSSLQAEETLLTNVIREAGRTTPVTVKVGDGASDVTLIREVSTHPVSGNLLHVDFLRVDVTQVIQAPVPVILFNQELAPGTRGGMGFVTQGIYEVLLEARPNDMPQSVEADCQVLESFDDAILVSDLPLDANVAIAGDPEERVAWIQPPRVIEDEDETEEGEFVQIEGEASADEEVVEEAGT